VSEPEDEEGPPTPPWILAAQAQAAEAQAQAAPYAQGAPYPPAAPYAPIVPASSADSGPILPPAFDPNAFQDALGPPPPPRAQTEPSPYGRYDDEPKAAKRRRRTVVVSAFAIIVGIGIATFVFLGRASSSHYYVVCEADHVSAEQGRSFPPWGSHAMSGAEWKPIALPPNAECKPKETDEPDELAKWYLDVLVDRASSALTARGLLESIPHPGGAAAANPLDTIAAQLDQALLLARAPERRDQRKDIERLQGDVEYWRAAARARDAAASLVEAAKQFDAAAALRPRHVDDASQWATFSRKVADEIHGGPNGAPPPIPGMPPGDTHVPAPMGSALPVEPPPTGSDTATTAAPTPDAGVPTGGVLL